VDDSTADDGIVVIGGGPCAAVAARELVRAGQHVTMLDAGWRAPRGVFVRCGGRTVVRWVEPGHLAVNRHAQASDPATEWTSSLSAGGLTNYWTGAVPRFAPGDFTEGAALDERFDWPIRYEDLAPYYDLVERDLRIAAGDGFDNVPTGRVEHRVRLSADWRAFAEAAADRGHRVAPMPLAIGAPWRAGMRPREFTSDNAIVRPLSRAPAFRLRRGAHVVRLALSRSSERAESVVFIDRRSGRVEELRARAFVVAAGALDTTEILLRSASDELPGGLGSRTGVLGRYLHDHPKEWWPANLSSAMTALHHPLYVSRDDDSTSPLVASSLTFGLASGRDRLATFAARRLSRIGVQVFGTMVPDESGRVELVDGTDPNDPTSALRIDLRYTSDAVANMAQARRRFSDVCAAGGISAEIGPVPPLAPGRSVHFGGTARMHRRAEFGVVDEWNRVHGTPNVIVVDSSCFTTGPEKNPTSTAMAIATRAARHLAVTA